VVVVSFTFGPCLGDGSLHPTSVIDVLRALSSDGAALHLLPTVCTETKLTFARSMLALVTLSITLAGSSAGCRFGGHDATRRRAALADTSVAPGPRSSGTSTARTILVTAHEYAFTGVPARIHAGWLTFRLANAGSEVHMLGIARVPYGHSARVEPETTAWGGPNAVSPGDTATVTLFFPAGEYAITCSVESADGKRHSLHGMMALMTVTGTPDSSSEAAHAPAPADVNVTLTDYHVGVRGTLSAGDRTVHVQNGASRGHDLEILEILPGHSAADAMRWFEHPARETPTARAIGGVVAIHPGQEAVVSATFRPGNYLFLCWVPDSAGRPHFQRGMHQAITVAAARSRMDERHAW
jgi:uncharacterized cupredoxin-like copper-binding protein